MTLLETDEVIALDKPAGISMATSSRAGKSAQEAVRRLLEACGAQQDDDLLMVHRLDVGTSGVVLLARTVVAHRSLSRAFQTGGVRKTYRAVVWGHPRPAEGLIDEPLGRDPSDGRKMKVTSGGKHAATRYRTLARLPSVAELALHPETGRTHQIRVHLSARGHPVVGDDLYGGSTRWHGVKTPVHRRLLASVRRPLLHAERIEIPELAISVQAPLPRDYERVLTALAASLSRPITERR